MASDASVSRTFADIETEAQAWESKLSSAPAGRVVALQIGNHPAWPAIFLAAIRRGLAVLPLETTISANDCATALALTCAYAHISASEGGEATFRALAPDASTDSPVALTSPTHVLLKFTSGTTAAPRAVCFRGEQLLADCDNICETMGIDSSDVNYGVIPISHSYGFSNLLTPLISRGVPIALTRDRLPRAILNGLASSRATVFPGMPVFYQAFCGFDDVPDLPALRLCISAGAPLTGRLAREYYERFGRPIHSFYGSSECGGICYDRVGTHFEDGFVGTPMQNVDISFRESGSASSPIEVRSGAVADTYFPNPEPEKLGRGVFRPDDLLRKTAGGFRIAGRISDLINVAGKKVNPAEIEAYLLTIKGVREAVVFGRPSRVRNEDILACVVTDQSTTEAELVRVCRAHLTGWQVPRRIFLVPEIPVNERGKTSRRQLAELFASR